MPVVHVIRSVWRGRVWAAGPWTVVEDSADLHASYLAPRTKWWMPPLDVPPGTRRRWMNAGEWPLVEFTWRDVHVLRLQRPGDGFSVELWWTLGFEPIHWKVNLETPSIRTSIGLDTMDLTLDVIIDVDLRSWEWKDEAEFATLERDGLLTPAESLAVRRDGTVARELVMSESEPFGRRWLDWRPHTQWHAPVLTDGWRDVAPR